MAGRQHIGARDAADQGLVGKAILDAAIITGAGGSFGKVSQNSGIAAVVGSSLSDTLLGILLPFVIAASIKTAQGPSTVSLITTAGLMGPLLTPLGLDGETAKALVVVAFGCLPRVAAAKPGCRRVLPPQAGGLARPRRISDQYDRIGPSCHSRRSHPGGGAPRLAALAGSRSSIGTAAFPHRPHT